MAIYVNVKMIKIEHKKRALLAAMLNTCFGKDIFGYV